jgi:hypothetical protein
MRFSWWSLFIALSSGFNTKLSKIENIKRGYFRGTCCFLKSVNFFVLGWKNCYSYSTLIMWLNGTGSWYMRWSLCYLTAGLSVTLVVFYFILFFCVSNFIIWHGPLYSSTVHWCYFFLSIHIASTGSTSFWMLSESSCWAFYCLQICFSVVSNTVWNKLYETHCSNFVMCVCVCVHVCMYVCMYVCTYVRTYVCLSVCLGYKNWIHSELLEPVLFWPSCNILVNFTVTT